ncbi:MAG: FISUMP domain-containing protein [Ignavibacteriaceae bacterium]
MKLRNMLCCFSVIVLLTSQLRANTNPVVTEVQFSISATIVTVTYKVADAEQSTVAISMEVSSDAGATWDFDYGTASGNIGDNVAVGAGVKTITWVYTGPQNNYFKIRIIANDLVIDGGPCVTPSVLYEGVTYNTVQIGKQCWLKGNLNVGSKITGGVTQTDNGQIEKYCYDNDDLNCTLHGGLYQWAEAVQYKDGATNTTPTTFTGNVRGICPSGWHIPAEAEFVALKTAVGSDGNSLKEVGQGTGSGVGTNTSGFSALMSGGYYETYFAGLTFGTHYLGSTNIDIGAYDLYLTSNLSNMFIASYTKVVGFSVRCIKD